MPTTSRRRLKMAMARYRAMTMALKRAGITPSDVDYINAHGTSTPLGDEIELRAVERLFGNSAAKLAMSSTKSSIGHLLGAAGAVEAIFSTLAIRDLVAPPTLNLDNPSVETMIDLVPHQAEENADFDGAFKFLWIWRHECNACSDSGRIAPCGSRWCSPFRSDPRSGRVVGGAIWEPRYFVAPGPAPRGLSS